MHTRTVDLSLWAKEGSALGVAPLLQLATLASRAKWKPKNPGAAGSGGAAASVTDGVFWCPDTAVVAARAAAVGVVEAEGAWVEAEAGAAGEAAPQVRRYREI